MSLEYGTLNLLLIVESIMTLNLMILLGSFDTLSCYIIGTVSSSIQIPILTSCNFSHLEHGTWYEEFINTIVVHLVLLYVSVMRLVDSEDNVG